MKIGISKRPNKMNHEILSQRKNKLNYEKNLEQIERGKQVEAMLKEVLSKLENSELRSD